MYYVPEGTTRCGYYECESCGEKFLSLQTMEHINCPYCEAEFDPEIGPDETMQVAEDTAKLIQVLEARMSRRWMHYSVLPLPVEISSGYNVCTDEAIS